MGLLTSTYCNKPWIKYYYAVTQARIQEFLVEGDDMDEEKIGRGLGAALGPQRGPGAEPLVGVKGAKPPTKVKLFSRIIQ
jgi:hypothetical protein